MTARIGIDLGGTKIAGLMTRRDPDGAETVAAEHRILAPRNDYTATIAAIVAVVDHLERSAGPLQGPRASVGIGMPGSLSPTTGLVQNANSVWLNGQPLQRDLEAALGRPLRFANDANCFALSEATDGAAAGARVVFGVILGTGCGGGIVVDGKLVDGPHAIGGEWGHTPLPWMTIAEFPGATCWCGRTACLETFVSGTGLAADHQRITGTALTAEAIVAAAAAGDATAAATLTRHVDRLARGLALISNILDPDVIVLGGGLSKLGHLYTQLPGLMTRHMFTDHARPAIRPPRFGDASGVRGAVRLWP
jgi:fructokinase